ncbi:calcium-binding protein [Nocardioides sp. zg-1228]|uniref:calcium-binding protein n=1 Tax=Nocardioides sp. zg-1228 TaxID=2763008 RepID=UPI00164355F5|nr:calcium-binding protein [Nocardioides sp. zg-1228]MBC2931844.1 hypothetical protein [Nocardioides sp. zg-1228]QSF57413.1 hypothetical protein JX575_18030 [Nocardioides sp. zg-1228]
MRRTTPLTAAALLVLTLLGPTGAAASAAAETCRGEVATLVGAGQLITGTEGRDVIVTNGATRVVAVGGDDVICLTGMSPSGHATIDAGAGDDLVDGTAWRGSVQAELGEGADRFEGGDGENVVAAGPADTARDVIIGGDARDVVDTGVPGEPNADVVDLGAGDDALDYAGVMAPGGSIAGGDGVDELLPSTSRSGATTIDNASGTLVVDQQVIATWSGLETFYTGTIGGAPLQFVGTAADEALVARASGPVDASFGAGDDTLVADEAPRAGSSIEGGRGHDGFYVTTESGLLDLDLARGRLVTGAEARRTIPVTDFENASLYAHRVVLTGTRDGNSLTFGACDATVRGRGGADTVQPDSESMFETVFCPRFPKARVDGGRGDDDLRGTRGRDVLRGGTGNDRLDGRQGPDRLHGGAGRDELRGRSGEDELRGESGRDRADGGSGRDSCRAERERRCER